VLSEGRNKGVPPRPRLIVKDEAGKVVYEAQMEYG